MKKLTRREVVVGLASGCIGMTIPTKFAVAGVREQNWLLSPDSTRSAVDGGGAIGWFVENRVCDGSEGEVTVLFAPFWRGICVCVAVVRKWRIGTTACGWCAGSHFFRERDD